MKTTVMMPHVKWCNKWSLYQCQMGSKLYGKEPAGKNAEFHPNRSLCSQLDLKNKHCSPIYSKHTHACMHAHTPAHVRHSFSYTHCAVVYSCLNGASHRQAGPFVRSGWAMVQLGQHLSRPPMVVTGPSAVSSSVSTRTRPTSCAVCSAEVSSVRYVTMWQLTVWAYLCSVQCRGVICRVRYHVAGNSLSLCVQCVLCKVYYHVALNSLSLSIQCAVCHLEGTLSCGR